MLRWSIELNEFDIQYVLRVAIKTQVLMDFISKLTPSPEVKVDKHTPLVGTLFVDCLATSKRGDAGLVLKGSNKQL